MQDEHIPLLNNIVDTHIENIFGFDIPYHQLLESLSTEDILVPSKEAQVPFFASIKDYQGAYYKNNTDSFWIIKPLAADELLQARLGMFVYFLNHITETVSAPSIVTKINGKHHKASKIIPRTEQLSGAPYHANKHLTAQLSLDLINSWIYFDEDRNPNNYLIYYNSKNIPVVITIDFSNVDLLSKGMKIQGKNEIFGWERKEKTRYMTPLKNEQFYDYSFDFYRVRLDKFKRINREMLRSIGNAIFLDEHNNPDEKTVNLITDNILARIEYVYSYFEKWFNDPENRKLLQKRSKKEMKDEYRLMGKFFNGT